MKFFLFLLSFSFCTVSFAQNYMYDYGDSGFIVSGHLLKHYEGYARGFSFGFILGGKLSGSIGWGNESHDIYYLQSKSFAFNLNHYVLKEKKGKLPLSTGIGLAYQKNTFDAIDSESLALSGFIEVAKKIYSSDNLNINAVVVNQLGNIEGFDKKTSFYAFSSFINIFLKKGFVFVNTGFKVNKVENEYLDSFLVSVGIAL